MGCPGEHRLTWYDSESSGWNPYDCVCKWTTQRMEEGAADCMELHTIQQVCAVLPCPFPSMSCLKYKSPAITASLSAIRLVITGASNSTVFPEVTACDSSHEQYLLRPGNGKDSFEFVSSQHGEATLAANSAGRITSVVLYGRLFDKDELPYKCAIAPQKLLAPFRT